MRARASTSHSILFSSVFVVSSAVASVVIVAAAVCEVALASGGDGSSRVAENRFKEFKILDVYLLVEGVPSALHDSIVVLGSI